MVKRLSLLAVFLTMLLVSQPALAANMELRQAFIDLPQVSVHVVTDIAPTADALSATLMGKPLELKEVLPIRESGKGLACVFLVDISASLNPAQLLALKNVMRQWANTMGKYDWAAVITVGEAVTTIAPFNRDPNALRTAAMALKANDQKTLWYEGMTAAKKLFEETKDIPERHIVIALSDGMNDGGSLQYIGMLEAVKEFGAPYYMLGLVPAVKTAASDKALKEMQEVATATRGTYYPVTREDVIISAVGAVQTIEFSGVLAVFEAPGGIPYDGSKTELTVTYTKNGVATTQNIIVALTAQPGVTPKPEPTPAPSPSPTPSPTAKTTPTAQPTATTTPAPTPSPTPEATATSFYQTIIVSLNLPPWWPWAAGALAALLLAVVLLIVMSAKKRRRKRVRPATTLDTAPIPARLGTAPPSDDAITAQPEPEPALGKDSPWMPGWQECASMSLNITMLGDDGSHFPFDIPTKGRLVIGSGPSVGLTLEGAGLKARHCELFFMDGHWFAADLGSGTTRLNSIAVQGAARVEDRDLLQLGEVKLIVRLPDPHMPLPAE